MATAYTEESFRVGSLSREELENECIENELEFNKHTSSDELRSMLLDNFEHKNL